MLLARIVETSQRIAETSKRLEKIALLSALRSGLSADFEALPLGGPDKEADPQGAYAYMLEGPDSGGLSVPVPPTFSSAWQAADCAHS